MKIVLHYLPAALVALLWVGFAVWLFLRALQRSVDPAKLVFKWILTVVVGGASVGVCVGVGLQDYAGAFIVPITCAVGGILTALIWGENIATMLIAPLTSAIDGGQEAATPEPLYSIARSKRNRGEYQAAIHAIQEQLEQFPTDFTGQMMIAEIQALELKDLPGAEMTIERLLAQPERTPGETASALVQLGDWQFKFNQDIETVRGTFQRIITELPDSAAALTAAQRLAHLEAAQAAKAETGTKVFAMPRGLRNIGLRKDQGAPQAKPDQTEERVAALISQLEQHPLDLEAREQLAVLYAEYYRRVDLACDQLEQMIALPHQQPAAVVHWLHLMADFQVQLAQDSEAATRALQRITELFPDHPLAAQARQRLELLKLELRRGDQAQVVQLGTYEKNLGLKHSPDARIPRPPDPS